MCLFFVGGVWSLCLAQNLPASASFVVVGSQFHVRSRDDAGEARICVQNIGRASLSMAQLRIQIVAQRPDQVDQIGTEQKYLYARLSPPVLQAGQYGLLVAKLSDRPANGSTLACIVSALESTTSCTVPLKEVGLWISYVGFAPDLRTVFVYVENTSDETVRMESLQVGAAQAFGEAVNRLVPPGDKGCLIDRLAPSPAPGEFAYVAVSAQAGGQDVHVHTVVRAINRIPLVVAEGGTFVPGLGLDSAGFTETMTCIAHAHGTPEQAAGTFWEDYVQRFRQNPYQVIQMDICRYNSPWAWFHFGSLPDVARMNPILPVLPNGDREDPRHWFNAFLYRGGLARKAVEPCRYVAVLSLTPEEDVFLPKELTPQEVRFLVYCAVASGAKGLSYRRMPADDQWNRSALARLNQELRQIEPLLLVGEPVDWATTTHDNYAVESLWCGDQALLALVFDRRYLSRQRVNRFYTPPFERAVTPVRVEMRVPRDVSVGQVRSLSAPLERGAWVCREGTLSFTVDMIDSVHVVVVDLQSRTRLPAGGGSAP